MHPDQLAHLRLELQPPAAIRQALAASPIIYLPLGTFEWHGEHLPIGLDALKAHGLCLQAAARTGGMVMPPFYYGTGGGHIHYTFTIMLQPEQIAPILDATLLKLAEWGVKKAIMLTGHYPGEQVDMVKDVAARWTNPGMSVLALTDAFIAGKVPLVPDHAGAYETGVYSLITPELIHLEALPPIETHPDYDVPTADFWKHSRHDKDHPLHGIFGADPRVQDPWKAYETHTKLLDWLVEQVQGL